MSTLYEVSSLTALVMNKPNMFSQVLGVLNRGDQIDVISISKSWAYFKYNNINAYVKKGNLKILNTEPIEAKGSVTLKYIDITTNNEIYPSETINNLELRSHNYEARIIYNYKLQNDSTQSVNLTEENPNQIITFYYNQVLGTITIKYMDITTGTDIYESKTIENLPLGTYTYGAINLSSYILNDNEIKAVTITETSPNATITFKYNSLLGNITIKYLDSSTLTEIAPATRISNIALGSYTYDAIYIDKYEVDGDSIVSITLTTTEPNKIISFKYNKIEIPYDLNWNEVPYISTYYIKPIVKPGEEVFIDYYITDYYQKEYIEEDYSETFTVTVRVEGQNDKLYHYLKAGDHQVSLGSFSTEGEQKFSILCADKYGRNSHELFNFFLVQGDVEIKEYIMTEDDLVTYSIKNTDNYEVKNIIDLSSLITKDSTTVKAALVEAASNIIPKSRTYVCVIADTDGDGTPNNWWGENQVVYASDYNKDEVLHEAINTRIGLQQLLDDKKAAGYNKLTLLPGTYRIDHQTPIYIPTHFTLDLNKATIKLNQFQGENTLMLELDNTFDSHLINGTLEGDYFTHIYDGKDEQNHGVGIYNNSKFSSIENLLIKDIVGYGAINGFKLSRTNSTYNSFNPIPISGKFSLCDISRTNGNIISSTTRLTCDFIDISTCVQYDYLVISRYLGYQGNSCGTWNIICHFYNINKEYIISIDSYQYRIVKIPKDSYFLKITILNSSSDTTGLTINSIQGPRHCAFKNNKFNNVRCVGYSPFKMNDMLAENLSFINCGQAKAISDIDCEDGWDMMQDSTFKLINSQNYDGSGFVAFGGHNLIIDTMIDGNIGFSSNGRCNSYVIRNCKNIKRISLVSNSRFKSGYIRFYKNTCTNGINIINSENSDIPLSIKYCDIIGYTYSTTVDNTLFINCNLSDSSTPSSSLGKGIFKNCNITSKKGQGHSSGKYFNCTLKDISGWIQGNLEFTNCNIFNMSLEHFDSTNTRSLSFYKCIITNLILTALYWGKPKNFPILISNCQINNTSHLISLPLYTMRSPISLIENTITSTSTNGLILFHTDDIGNNTGEIGLKQDILSISKNKIFLLNSKYIITGLNNSIKNNINILFMNNTLTPSNLLLCDPTSKLCNNIIIIE